MYLLTNGNIRTMSSDNIKNGFLYIKDGKIAQIGSMNHLPPTLKPNEVINLGGKLVTPGFIDAHSHLGMSENGVGDEGEDINEMSDPIAPHLRALDAVDPLDTCFEESWRAGVTTTVTGPGSANPIAGQIVALKTYGRDVEKMTLAHPLAMKFALGENPKRIYGQQEQAPMSRMATAALIRENLYKAKRYLEDKNQASSEDGDSPELDFKMESLIPVINREIKAHFHAHRAYDIQTAIRIAHEFNLDYVIVHGTEGHRIADLLAEEGCSVICGPLMGTRSKPELSRQTLSNVSTLLKAGVNVAISSDHPEVSAEFLSVSAGILINHGISEDQALMALTYNAAKAVGLDHRVGGLAVGMDADILVFNGSPFNVARTLEMVFIDGQKIV